MSFSQSDKDISSTRLKLPTSADTHVAESSPLTPPPVAVFTAVRPCCPAGALCYFVQFHKIHVLSGRSFRYHRHYFAAYSVDYVNSCISRSLCQLICAAAAATSQISVLLRVKLHAVSVCHCVTIMCVFFSFCRLCLAG